MLNVCCLYLASSVVRVLAVRRTKELHLVLNNGRAVGRKCGIRVEPSSHNCGLIDALIPNG